MQRKRKTLILYGGIIKACTFCHSFVAQMKTGDLSDNSKSIKELVKQLSLSSTFYSMLKDFIFLNLLTKYHLNS